jgi:hypothetical protein
VTFLGKLLPSEGYICVAMLLPGGGFRHFFVESVEEAQKKIDALDCSGQTVFVAQATFETTDNRKQTNAKYLKNFFLDIDCGDGKDYPSQKEAAEALKAFVAESGLPFPEVVSSGNGLYAHWVMDELIPAQQWKTIARILKDTTTAYGFRTDPSRTADSASVLRPVGATHRKDPTNPKTVRHLTAYKNLPLLKFNDFVAKLSKAAKRKKVDTAPTHAPSTAKDLNADFIDGTLAQSPKFAEIVASKCPQMKHFRDVRGNVSEPLWYAMLGVIVHCEDGDEHLQEWSSGHPDYSEAVTAAKAQQYRDSGSGPSTCAKIGSINPDGCIGCPYNSKIKSPIILGIPEPKPLEVVEKKLETLKGFRRSEDGLYYEEDGRWMRFYDCDLYIDRIAYDMSLGYQVAVIKHCLPHEGCLEFMIRSSLIHDQKQLMVALSDNNVHVVGSKEKKIMGFYIEGHMAKLQRQQKMTMLLNQMGWKTDNNGKTLFVLGKKLFYEDGTIEEASLARNVPTAAQGFCSKGDLTKWVLSTEVFNGIGMEPYAFALLCGFGAPLMRFTGFDGALVSLVGDSGVGKTLMLRLAQSIYGNHSELMMLRDDTKNALVSRLGVYGNLPLTVDEVTNIDGQELSDLVYRVTQGRDKARLTKNSEERKNVNAWNTLAMVTTNSALSDKLSSAKHDASAELNRIFEYYVPAIDEFSGDSASDLFWMLHQNYGHAGERYIHYLVQNHQTIQAGLEKVKKKIEADAQIRGDERFWAAIAATAIYGGLIAAKLGLIRFEVSRVLDWAEKQLIGMRGDKKDLAEDAIGVLAQFIDSHSTNRLVVRGSAVGGKEVLVMEAPRGALVMRHEIQDDLLYISRSALKTYIAKGYGSYHKIRTDLQEIGALKNPNKSKALGSGTTFTGAAQACWVIDLNCRKLGAVGLQLVASAQTKEKITALKKGGKNETI